MVPHRMPFLQSLSQHPLRQHPLRQHPLAIEHNYGFLGQRRTRDTRREYSELRRI